MDSIGWLTLVLVVITAYYAWQTRSQASAAQAAVEEMRAAREAESAPYVVAFFDAPAGVTAIDVVVKNVGRTLAKNVRVHFTPEITSRFYAESQLLFPTFLSEGIPSMPPGFEMRTAMWPVIGLFAGAHAPARTYRAHVEYEVEQTGRSVAHEYDLDLQLFQNRLSLARAGGNPNE